MKKLLSILLIAFALQVNAQTDSIPHYKFVKKIVLQPEISYIAVDFTTPVTTDDPNTKTITAKFNLIGDDGQLWDFPTQTLWKDSTYDFIGIWNDTDVAKRVIEIIKK